MSEVLKILLDQNVPFAVKAWLQMSKPGWSVVHVNEVGLAAEHAGVIRMKVWPTTVEETVSGLQRLLEEVDDQEIRHSLVIIDQHKIRIRKVARSSH